MTNGTYDVIIAGCGAGGLYAALSLDSSLSVLIFSKGELELSNSALAQGGIASVLDRDNDNRELHIKDTLIAGGYKNNIKAVEVLVDNGPAEIENLIRLGVDFDTDALGQLHLTLEGGHSRHRIVHHKDYTGLEVVRKLIQQAALRPNINMVDRSAMLNLERDGNGFHAGILRDGKLYNVTSKYLIMATGGIGRVYKYTTNSKIATGDGIMFAEKLGAQITDLSLIQFHPTAFAGGGNERPLISESVRGEGAWLLNCNKYRFMRDYDERGELAPRDVVSNCIREESIKTGSERFYLDITHEDPEFVKDRFPGIYAKCLEFGIDMTKDLIPVFPCQHYLMGGIDVDTYARTSVNGLYAVGECSHTGVHGRNRLASNSLLEALVFSHRAATDIGSGKNTPAPIQDHRFTLKKGAEIPASYRDEISEILQKGFFIKPDLDACKRGLSRIDEIISDVENGGYASGIPLLETQSASRIAKIVLTEVLSK